MGVLRFLSTRRSYFRQRIAVHQHFASFREVKIPTVRKNSGKIATRLRKSRSPKGSPGQISHAFSNPTSQRRFSWQIATPPRPPCAQLTLKMTSRSPLYFCLIFEGLHRTIRPTFKNFSCMRSASVDLVRSRLSLVDF